MHCILRLTPRLPVQLLPLIGINGLLRQDGYDLVDNASGFEQEGRDVTDVLYHEDLATDQGHVGQELVEQESSEDVWKVGQIMHILCVYRSNLYE